MPFSLIPKRFSDQPQPLVELSTSYKYSAVFFTTLTDPFYKDIVAGNNLSAGSMVAPSRVARQTGLTSYFDGATTRLSTTNPYIPSTAFTVFCWTRPAALNSGYARLVETDYLTGFYLGANTGTQYAFIVNNSPLEGCIGGQQVAGQRDFVVGVFDGTNLILYVNGLQVATTTSTALTNATNVICVGAYTSANNVAVWNGDIDTIGIFNKAFSPAEIYALYQYPSQIYKAPMRRVFYSTPVVVGPTSTAFRSTLSALGTRSGSRQVHK